jgi:hypothetical protein
MGAVEGAGAPRRQPPNVIRQRVNYSGRLLARVSGLASVAGSNENRRSPLRDEPTS